MAGIKISDLVVAPVIAGDIVITQRGSANYGGTLGDQITAIESLIEAFQSDTSTAALSIKVDQNNLYTNSTASILFDNNNGTTVGRILWDETSSTFNLGYGANSHLTINSSGNVGIGTVTPGNLLHVAGGVTTNLDALHLSGTSFADGETLGMTMGRAAVVMGRISVESAGAGQAGHMHLGTASGGVNTNHITLRSDGKVGIGTTTPTAVLQVVGDVHAGLSNTGTDCNFIGSGAGESNSGNSSSGFGYQTLYQNTGASSSGFGYQSLYQNTGDYNTASGFNAGRYQSGGTTALTTASNSVFVGVTTKGIQGAANQLVLGYAAESIGANSVVLGNDSIVTTALKGNVGIGTDAPATLVEFQGGLTTVGSILTLGTAETSVVANDVLGRVNFYAPLDAAGTDANLVAGSIVALAEGTFSASSNATSLLFQTGASEVATTKMTLTSAGVLTTTGDVNGASPTEMSYLAGVTSSLQTQITSVNSDLTTHEALTNNPHTVTKTQVGLGSADNTSDAGKPVSTAQATAIGVVQTDINDHEALTNNPHTVTKAQVGLGSADDTTDAGKPVSTAQATAIGVVQTDINDHEALTNNPHTVTKAQVGLSNVDNTTDLLKPLSTASIAALALKAPLASPAFTGNVGIGTASPGNLLHVAGAVSTNLDALHLSGTSFADGETLGMTMGRAAVVMGRISVEAAGAGQAGHMHLGTASGGVNTNHITLRSSGKVGIGTTSPLGLLTVEGSPMFIRNGLLASQKEQMRLGRSDDSGANIRYHSIDTKHASAAASNALILKVHDGSSTTAQTSVMTLLGNGRVGIGTTSPNETLHVDGTVMLENLPTSDPSNTGELWNDSGTLKISA
tara:strand:+ start:3809 stop:6364 length:2556 start_codon:yes stop_codon:yes gene_type:complete